MSDEWELVSCCTCGSLVKEKVSENGTPTYDPLVRRETAPPSMSVVTRVVGPKITDLVFELLQLDQDSTYEVAMQDNPNWKEKDFLNLTVDYPEPRRFMVLLVDRKVVLRFNQ